MSTATNRPPGLRSATIGVRPAIESKSSIENGMSSSRAIASRWSTPLVEPPLAATAAAAFSSASRVMICEGRTSSRTSRITIRPHSSAASPLPRLIAGIPFMPAGLMPRKSSAIDIVLAVYWPPHAPAAGQAADSTSWSSSASILSAAYAPTASKTSWIVMSRPRNVPGRDRPVVEHQAGQVEPGQRHRGGRDRLVAADQAHQPVEQVAAGDQLDRVGDHLAADQRRAHALGAHRDPVGHRTRC